MSRVAFSTVGLHLLSFLVFAVYWLIDGMPAYDLKDIVLFKTTGYEFFIDFYFDRVTATYLLWVRSSLFW